MNPSQIAAIIYAVICLTYGGKIMTPEPQLNMPPPKMSEIHITLESGTAVEGVQKETVREIVIKQDPAPEPEKPKPSLVGPAFLTVIAILVFGNGG